MPVTGILYIHVNYFKTLFMAVESIYCELA